MGLAATVQRWWADQRVARAYAALVPDERKSLARDVGVSEDTLGRIVSRGSDAGAELGGVLQAVCLDPDDLRRSHPEVMRDMQVICSLCPAVRQCRRDLKHGISRLTFHQYCPNTETIAALEGRTWWRGLVRA